MKIFKSVFFLCHFQFLVVLFPVAVLSQNITISGYVYDAGSGETIISAYLFMQDSVPLAVTNNYGYYSVTMAPGEHRLICHAIGYKDTMYVVQSSASSRLDFYLSRNQLNTVVIHANRILRDQLNVVPLTVAELKSIPQPGGEPDLMKALSMAPGISAAGEGLSKLIVRGGEVDQNLIKLDGATVYNASHAFGFVSIFNPDAIKSVVAYKGGFPARYGGRLSSVIDFTMYEGNKKAMRGSYSIGTVTSHYFLEGPLKKDSSSFMLSARSSYLGLALLPLKYSFVRGNLDSYSNYWMYDLNGKVNFQVAKKGRMFLSLYTGKDFYYLVSKIYDDAYYDHISTWGNVTANARYTNALNPKLFMTAELSYNRYASVNTFKLFTDPGLLNFVSSVRQESSIHDGNMRVEFTGRIGKKDALNFGIEVNPVSFVPIKYTSVPGDSIRFTYLNNEIGNATILYHAIYADNSWQINDNAELKLGIRDVLYLNKGFARNKLEPRITYNYSPDNKYTLSFSYARMHQYINLLAASQIGFQEEFFLPTDSVISPQASNVYTIGYNRYLHQDAWYFSAEAYYKNMSGLITLKPAITSVQYNLSNIEDITATNGRGVAYGAEFFLKKEAGDFTGWIEYTLSWNNRRFNDINNGDWFPSIYDRRHDIGITGAYKLSDTWNMNATWVYVTGQPLTVPDAIYQDPYGYYYFHIPSINNGKLPDYHRLDISFTRNKLTKKQNNSAWSFGMYNAYGRINPVYANYVLQETKDPDGNVVHVEAVLRTTTLFRFLPFITYSLKFNNERKYY